MKIDNNPDSGKTQGNGPKPKTTSSLILTSHQEGDRNRSLAAEHLERGETSLAVESLQNAIIHYEEAISSETTKSADRITQKSAEHYRQECQERLSRLTEDTPKPSLTEGQPRNIFQAKAVATDPWNFSITFGAAQQDLGEIVTFEKEPTSLPPQAPSSTAPKEPKEKKPTGALIIEEFLEDITTKGIKIEVTNKNRIPEAELKQILRLYLKENSQEYCFIRALYHDRVISTEHEAKALAQIASDTDLANRAKDHDYKKFDQHVEDAICGPKIDEDLYAFKITLDLYSYLERDRGCSYSAWIEQGLRLRPTPKAVNKKFNPIVVKSDDPVALQAEVDANKERAVKLIDHAHSRTKIINNSEAKFLKEYINSSDFYNEYIQLDDANKTLADKRIKNIARRLRVHYLSLQAKINLHLTDPSTPKAYFESTPNPTNGISNLKNWLDKVDNTTIQAYIDAKYPGQRGSTFDMGWTPTPAPAPSSAAPSADTTAAPPAASSPDTTAAPPAASSPDTTAAPPAASSPNTTAALSPTAPSSADSAKPKTLQQITLQNHDLVETRLRGRKNHEAANFVEEYFKLIQKGKLPTEGNMSLKLGIKTQSDYTVKKAEVDKALTNASYKKLEVFQMDDSTKDFITDIYSTFRDHVNSGKSKDEFSLDTLFGALKGRRKEEQICKILDHKIISELVDLDPDFTEAVERLWDKADQHKKQLEQKLEDERFLRELQDLEKETPPEETHADSNGKLKGPAIIAVSCTSISGLYSQLGIPYSEENPPTIDCITRDFQQLDPNKRMTKWRDVLEVTRQESFTVEVTVSDGNGSITKEPRTVSKDEYNEIVFSIAGGSSK